MFEEEKEIMSEIIIILIVLNTLFVFLIAAGVNMWKSPKDPNSYIDSQKVGIIILWLVVPTWFLLFTIRIDTIAREYRQVLEICYDNNLTLPDKYKADINQLKLKRFKDGL